MLFTLFMQFIFIHCYSVGTQFRKGTIFKKLKDLRVERRVKEKELNCLYTLTDYTDCAAMVEASEYNLAEIKRIMEVEEVEAECSGEQEKGIIQEQVQGEVEVGEMEDEMDMMQGMAG